MLRVEPGRPGPREVDVERDTTATSSPFPGAPQLPEPTPRGGRGLCARHCAGHGLVAHSHSVPPPACVQVNRFYACRELELHVRLQAAAKNLANPKAWLVVAAAEMGEALLRPQGDDEEGEVRLPSEQHGGRLPGEW